MPEKLQETLMNHMKKRILPSRFFLNKISFPNEDLRHKPEYQDYYWGFWYYLGREEKPKNLLDVGNHFGLEAAFCVEGSKPPILVNFCNTKEPRFAIANVKNVGGNVDNHKHDWDVGIVNGEFSGLLPSIWDGMKLGGLLCVIDAKEAIEEFAKVKNRNVVFCELRHNIGLLRK